MKTFILISSILITSLCFGQRINVRGTNWNNTFQASDISSAGSDYKAFYESKTNQHKITFSSKPRNNYTDNYRYFALSIHKEDINWHPNLRLEVKRTGGSTNGHTLYYGDYYRSITNNSSIFFYSYGSTKNVPIQYKISGISVLLPAENYSTRIVYTIMNY